MQSPVVPVASPYAVRRGTIVAAETISKREKLFTVELGEGAPLGHRPGQFVMVSIFGAEEAAISVCSPPSADARFQLCVRRAGKLTTVLHRMGAGDALWFRGPYGNGYRTGELGGKRLLVVAGGLGLAPLRSLIGWAVEHRNILADLTVLYGAKSPHERIFGDELLRWRTGGAATVLETVDAAEPGWRGRVGVITGLIHEIEADPMLTVAAVCGPPVMYKFVVDALGKAGVRDSHLFVSLERRMRCALGKCGHCQINGVYTCQQGPVFSVAEARLLSEAL